MSKFLPKLLLALVSLCLLLIIMFFLSNRTSDTGSRLERNGPPDAQEGPAVFEPREAVRAGFSVDADDTTAAERTVSARNGSQASVGSTFSIGGGAAVDDAEQPTARTREDRLVEGGEVIAEVRRESGKGGVASSLRVRIIRNPEFKYPLLRVEEPLDETGQPAEDQRDVMVADHLIFKKAEGLSDEMFQERLKAEGLKVRRKMLAPDTYLVEIPVPDPAMLLRAFDKKQVALKTIGLAEPDYIVHAQDVLPNDPAFNSLWGLRNAEHSLTLTAQSPQVTYEDGGHMLYGGALPSGGISGDLIDCGEGLSGEFPGSVAGNIAFVRRGAAKFYEIAANAEAAGAVAVVLANTENSELRGSLVTIDDWLPFVVLDKSSGDAVKPLLPEPVVLSAEDTAADVDAPRAWELNRGSRGVVVGVIDTGIDYQHPDLVANMWTNTGETGFDGQGRDKRDNGLDDDDNGFVDDVHGYDFVNRDGDPDDDHFHGTHCAGTIGAVGDNGVGVAGVNWEVSLMGLKFLNSSGSGALSDGADAIYYATLMGADLTSNSWGGGSPTETLREAIEDANQNGLLFVAAAGNSATSAPSYPASYDNENIISVAAMDRDDNLAGFSNYGLPHTDIGAPGVNILSTYPTGHADGPYHAISGTSMATPHVAGVAALLISRAPSIPHLDVREQILSSAVPIPALEGKVNTGARLNAFAALSGVSESARYELIALGADDSAGNGDGVLNPGETISLTLKIFNFGYQGAEDVTASVSSESPWITTTDAQSVFGDVDGRTEATAGDPLVLVIDAGIPHPRDVLLTITFQNGAGDEVVLETTLPVSETTLLQGTVTLDGTPLPGADVELRGPSKSGFFLTDSAGSYEIPVGAGEFTLQASYQNEVLSYTQLSPVNTETPSGPVDFALETVTVHGKVLAKETGAGVQGATVRFRGDFEPETVTDADGDFAFTAIYGQPRTWEISATHPDFDFVSSAVGVTAPPGVGDIELYLGPPIATVSIDEARASAAPGETVAQDFEITNPGAADLTWSIATILNPNAAGGNELLELNQPAGVGNYADAATYDGEYLYWQAPGGTTLVRQNPVTGAKVDEINLQAILPEDVSAWRLVGYDGSLFWFSERVPAPRISGIDYFVLHAVDLDNEIVARSVSVDRALYWGEPEGNGFLQSRAWMNSVGAGSAWVRWRRWEHPDYGKTYSEWVAEISLTDGSLLNSYKLPEDVLAAYKGGTAYYLSDHHYMNGSLWISQNITFSGIYQSDRVIFKVNPATGEILREIAVPDHDKVTTLAADDTGALWAWVRDSGKIYKIDSGERSWVQVTPRAGEVMMDGTARLDLTFNADLAAPGMNYGALRFDTNDPDRRLFYLPVALFAGTPEAGNQAPVLDEGATTPGSPLNLTETDAQEFHVTVTDPDSDPLTYTWLLDGKQVHSATGSSWTWTTGYADAGSHLVSVGIDDGRGGYVMEAWHVNVANRNRVPVAESTTFTVANTDTLDLELAASDADGEPLLYTITRQPTHGVISGDPPELTYDPEDTYTGSDSLEFFVNDGMDDSAVATVTLEVGSRDLLVDSEQIEVVVPPGGQARRTIRLTNAGTLPVRWSAPMEALTGVPRAGEVIDEISLRDNQWYRGLAFDGQDLWVGEWDTSTSQSTGQRTHIRRISAADGSSLQYYPNPIYGFWIEYLSWDGSGLWSFSHDFVRQSAALPSYTRRHAVSADRDEITDWRDWERPEIRFTVGISMGGVSYGEDGLWLNSNNTLSTKGKIQRIEPSSGSLEVRSLVDYPQGTTGGASFYAHGALWVGGWSIHTGRNYITKINPHTGEELGRIPYNYDDTALDFAPDGRGGVYMLRWFDDDVTLFSRVTHVLTGDYIFAEPSTAELGAGEHIDVTVTLDHGLVGSGSHKALLHIISNDGNNPDIEVPVYLVEGKTYSSWRDAAAWPANADKSPLGKIAGSQVENLVAYFSGLNPTGAHDPGALPKLGKRTDSDEDWVTLTFRRNKAATDVDWSVKHSTTLGGWETLTIDGMDVVKTVIDPDVTGDGSVELIEVKLRVQPNEDSHFMLLEIELAP